MTTRATELLRVIHARPGVTRADAARLIGVGTGATTELVGRLGHAELLAEAPAAPSGSRGRPTTALIPHPRGPLIAATSITHEQWRVDVVELGGAALATIREDLGDRTGDEVVAAVGAAVARLRTEYGDRIRGIGIAVPGTVSRDLMLDASNLNWRNVDLAAIWPKAGIFVAGNDATLAASAESHRGAAVGASVALHLRVEAGLGGAVVDGGRVLVGALGAAGEFGHMPFGDPTVECPCGAYGCWGTAVDGSALARLLGHHQPRDPISYARRVIASTDPAPAAATATAATALGRGIAGLVNGLDPDLVTLGGLGTDLLAAAPAHINQAYRAGLMGFRRENPPPILPSTLGDDGPLAGAAEEAWTALLTTLV
ncbi:ROK family protein [Winogradskya humida]|uniref:Xylose repressor n=1 Tax=Winogradskya humida TaxID=113566 RepID=A0ABQ4A618_9ACTN|nr:ROK family protein [Actinoplanes humidus]GIE26285.1 xylose repressor [Actinoplanes humidus]